MFRVTWWYILFLAALLVCLLVTSTPAAPRSRHVQPGQTHVDPYVPTVRSHYSNDRSIQARIVSDVLQINPGYSSFFAPEGYDAQTQADILNELRRQGFRLDQLATLVQTTKAAVVPGPSGTPAAIIVPVAPAQPATTPRTPAPASNAAIGLAVMNAKCSQCHQEGKLKPEQRFTLLTAKGDMVGLTDRQKMLVLSRVFSDEMPPQDPKINTFGIPPLQDQDKAGILALIRGN